MSNTRNELLAQIVTASGGTVRNKDNRNMLLEDWLTAVSGPAERYVFNFNGVNQYIDTDARIIDIDNLNGLSFELYMGNFSQGTIISQSDSASAGQREFQLFILTDLEVNLGGARTVIATSPNLPSSPGLLKVEFTSTEVIAYFSGSEIGRGVYTVGASRQPSAKTWICARGNGSGGAGFFKWGLTYNIKFNDGSVYNYPVDDGWSNNPTIRNTGSGANATLINGLESGWETINV